MEIIKVVPQLKSAVLVTGGAGFIGSHLVDALLAQGHRVVVVDDFNEYYAPTIKRANVRDHLLHPYYTLVEGDIRDAKLLDQVIGTHSIESVVHLAARVGVRPSLEQPHLYEATNITGTLNVLESMKKHGVKKLVFGSSSSVYGVNNKIPFSEEDPIAQPISPYAATKAAGELFCHSYSHLYGLNITCLRFFTVYGPRQRPDLAIHKFATLIHEGRPIPVYGDGSTERDYTFVSDIVHGILSALHYTDTPFEIINLGNSKTISLALLIAIIEEAIGKPAHIERHSLQPGDVPRTFADTAKAARLLGYAPNTPIEDGIARFVEWLRSRDFAEVSV